MGSRRGPVGQRGEIPAENRVDQDRVRWAMPSSGLVIAGADLRDHLQVEVFCSAAGRLELLR
ncbi:hypothetical protein GCM10025787_02820 [Saccharopolyspora rosea]